MKKVLFVSHLANFSKFNLPLMDWFHGEGWQVHYASLGEEKIPRCDRQLDIPFHRSPFHPGNVEAYRQMRQLMHREHYDIIHCHTPMGGVITRLAARDARKQGTRVIYTAHGFHFFKGAPLRNWLFYFPVEKFLARYTDCLITINEEDYRNAQKYRFRAKQIVKVHGAGVDTERFSPVPEEEKRRLREQADIAQDAFVLIYVAEFIPRKNHAFLLKAAAELREQIPELQVLLAGQGRELERCQALAKRLKLEGCVHFLGYRTDVEKLYQMADVAVSTSKQEGLPMNVLEAMACGLPIVCTRIRGHVDLEKPESMLWVYPDKAQKPFYQSILKMKEKYIDKKNVLFHFPDAVDQYDEKHVVQQLADIYKILKE